MLSINRFSRWGVVDPGSSRREALASEQPTSSGSTRSASCRHAQLPDSPLASLRRAPKPGTSAEPDILSSSSAPAIGSDPRVRRNVLAEIDRVGWTEATGVADRVTHRMQSLVGLRTSKDRGQAFVAFMAEGSGRLGAPMLDLGDSWTRTMRRVENKTASLDFRTDENGVITDARHPGRFPVMPPGAERAVYSNVLDELQSTGNSALRKVPVYYVNWNNKGYVLPTHGYVVAGDPDKGRRSGAVLYGVGGDPKRGPVLLDEHTLKRLNAKVRGTREYKLPEHVRTAVNSLSGESFASREDFCSAYSYARGEAGDPATIHEEMSSIYRLLSMSTMELWPKRTDDYRAARPASSERDIRAFENPPKDFRYQMTLKKISGVNSIDLLEAKQQFNLHQLYQDELLGRIGTGVPSELFPPVADAGRRSSLAAATPRFQRLPPHASDKVGNCNTGAASLLQRAMDKYGAPNAPRATSASVFGLGSGHRIAIWDPLKPRGDAGEERLSLPNSEVDSRRCD